MNYFEQKDFDIFRYAGQPRNLQLEAGYKSTLDKFKCLVDKINKALGNSYGYSMDTSCLTTPGKHVTQTLIGYKWAKIYMNNYQGVFNPDTRKNRIQNVFGLSISTNGLSIWIDKNANQITQKLTPEQSTILQTIHDKTEMVIDNADENTLVNTICQYITSHEDDYLENGIALGIYECIKKKNMNIYNNLILKNYNLILTGAPGTGKTYLAHEIAASMLGKSSWEEVEKDPTLSSHVGFVQFHPSYDYSDFVEGLRPVENGTTVGFKRMNGVFKEFCKQALLAQSNKENTPYIFIIDEINRGEMSKIFGELFFSIDPGYRGTKGAVQTQYANMEQKGNEFDNFLNNGKKGQFFVPKNVFIIGTMNDIDRSVESMDFAMRRRFAFKEITALSRTDMWEGKIDNPDEVLNRMVKMNEAIGNVPGLNSAYHIGPSYFLKLKDYNNDFIQLWDNHIKGVVHEYLRGMPDADKHLKDIENAYKKDK